MRSNPYQRYAEDEILTADPVKLIHLLYRGASDAVADARAKLAQGDARGRGTAITKAVEIFTELARALDHERGGELSMRLAALYDYMQRRLFTAHFEQADAPLVEVDGLLGILAEAWMSIEGAQSPVPAVTVRPGRRVNWVDSEEYVPLSAAC